MAAFLISTRVVEVTCLAVAIAGSSFAYITAYAQSPDH
jgi:hypothetical protein